MRHNHVPGVSSIMKQMGTLLREFTLIDKDGARLNFTHVLELKALIAQAGRNGDVIDHDRIAKMVMDAVFQASRFQFSGFNFNWTEKSTELLTIRMAHLSNPYSKTDLETILDILDEGYNALQQVDRVLRPQLYDDSAGAASSVNTVVVQDAKQLEDVGLSSSRKGQGSRANRTQSTLAAVWVANGQAVQAQQLEEFAVQHGGIRAQSIPCPNPNCDKKKLRHHIYCSSCGHVDMKHAWACPECAYVQSIFTSSGAKPTNLACYFAWRNCKGTIQGARCGDTLTPQDKKEVLGYIIKRNEKLAGTGKRPTPTTFVE